MRAFITILFGSWFLVVVPYKVNADDSYYMVVFASQAENGQARLSHTFATFVKASRDQENKEPVLTVNTISWLPATMRIAPRVRAETGKNFDLGSTLAWAENLGARVSAWGPFRIKKELYDSGLRRIKQLTSGEVGYKMLDSALRLGRGINCIHAAGELDVASEPLATGLAHGEEASLRVAEHFRPWIVRPEVQHLWLLEKLNNTNHKIESRELK